MYTSDETIVVSSYCENERELKKISENIEEKVNENAVIAHSIPSSKKKRKSRLEDKDNKSR